LSSPQDVLGKALQTMNVNLNSTMHEVIDIAETIAELSRTVAEDSQRLSMGATEQASAVKEIGASSTTILHQIQQNSENLNWANQLGVSVRKAADRGDASMRTMIHSMDEIDQASSNISQIIRVIDEISFHTNILALNAAVEAARAGRFGKGFAVVADEVRDLAGRSAQAARESTNLIDDSNKKVRQGIEIVQETAKSLEEIVQGVSKMSDLMAEVSVASKEQAAGVKQINLGLNQIEHTTSNNSVIVEESAAAAADLDESVHQLKQILTRFRLKQSSHALIKGV
ncbi:MAG: hypothetical protein HQM12_23120, partial [SAR324 cluster bacterium]|nr:hypothetical protein [SAR324 cluster bacterium]